MSEKFKVIAHDQFEKLQEKNEAASGTIALKIRNSKYKRMTSNNQFNLLQFVTVKTKGKKKRKIRKRVVDDRFKPTIKKKGKQRENGPKKKPSRLKKSILRYRQMKRDQDNKEHEEFNRNVSEELVVLGDDNKLVEPITVESSGIQHSSRFRDYCDNCNTKALKQHTERLIRELNRFQRRAYAQNEIKARAHRRFVIGLREVQNFLNINKVKLVIIATDCERCDVDAGLDNNISNIKKLCNNQQVPIAFTFQRRQLAYFLYKKASVSCIGILDYDGAREIFSQLTMALKDAKDSYEQLTKNSISQGPS